MEDCNEENYLRKFNGLQKYVSRLENHIVKLKATSSEKPREAQLQKMQMLYDLLLNKEKRLKLETLDKCEAVLIKLYGTVDEDPKVNGGVSWKNVNTQSIEHDKCSTSLLQIKTDHSCNDSLQGPDSPEPSSSFEHIYNKPIIIPGERTDGQNHLKYWKKPATTSNGEEKSIDILKKPPLSVDDLKDLLAETKGVEEMKVNRSEKHESNNPLSFKNQKLDAALSSESCRLAFKYNPHPRKLSTENSTPNKNPPRSLLQQVLQNLPTKCSPLMQAPSPNRFSLPVLPSEPIEIPYVDISPQCHPQDPRRRFSSSMSNNCYQKFQPSLNDQFERRKYEISKKRNKTTDNCDDPMEGSSKDFNNSTANSSNSLPMDTLFQKTKFLQPNSPFFNQKQSAKSFKIPKIKRADDKMENQTSIKSVKPVTETTINLGWSSARPNASASETKSLKHVDNARDQMEADVSSAIKKHEANKLIEKEAVPESNLELAVSPNTSNMKSWVEKLVFDLLKPSQIGKDHLLNMFSQVIDEDKFNQIKKIVNDEPSEGFLKSDTEESSINTDKSNSTEQLRAGNISKSDNNINSKPKMKQYRRARQTEIAKLNEDIHNMFIAEGVLTLTGQKMATVLRMNERGENPVRHTRSSHKQIDDSNLLAKMTQNHDSSKNCRTTSPESKRPETSQTKHAKKSKKPNIKGSMNRTVSETHMKVNSTLVTEEKIDSNVEQPSRRFTRPNRVLVPGHYVEPEIEDLPLPDSMTHLEEKKLPKPSTDDVAEKKDPSNLKCVYCTYTGKKLVRHYVNDHPDMEVEISKLDADTAKTVKTCSNKTVTGSINCTTLIVTDFCRFCHTKLSLSRLSWRFHIAGHTGEYPFRCNECNYRSMQSKTMINHISTICPDAKVIKDFPPNFKNGKLVGYLCDNCNYVQMQASKIIMHTAKHHNNKTIWTKINLVSFTPSSLNAQKQSEQEMEVFISPETRHAECTSEPLELVSDIYPMVTTEPIENITHSVADKLSAKIKSAQVQNEKQAAKIPTPGSSESVELMYSNFEDSEMIEVFFPEMENSNSDDANQIESIKSIQTQASDKQPANTNSDDQDIIVIDDNEWEDLESVESGDETVNKGMVSFSGGIRPSETKGKISDTLRRLFKSIRGSEKPNTEPCNEESSMVKKVQDSKIKIKKEKPIVSDADAVLQEPEKKKTDEIKRVTEISPNLLHDQLKVVDITNSNGTDGAVAEVTEAGCLKTTDINSATQQNSTVNPLSELTTELTELPRIEPSLQMTVPISNEVVPIESVPATSTTVTPTNGKFLSKNLKKGITAPIIEQVLSVLHNKEKDSSGNVVSQCMEKLIEDNVDCDKKKTANQEKSTLNVPNLAQNDIIDLSNSEDEREKVSESIKISNLVLKKEHKVIKLMCCSGSCRFASINYLTFQNHLVDAHKNVLWTGFCHACKMVISQGYWSLQKELSHLVEKHMQITYWSDLNAAPKTERPKISLRRLSGDKLSNVVQEKPPMVAILNLLTIPTVSEPETQPLNLHVASRLSNIANSSTTTKSSMPPKEQSTLFGTVVNPLTRLQPESEFGLFKQPCKINLNPRSIMTSVIRNAYTDTVDPKNVQEPSCSLSQDKAKISRNEMNLVTSKFALLNSGSKMSTNPSQNRSGSKQFRSVETLTTLDPNDSQPSTPRESDASRAPQENTAQIVSSDVNVNRTIPTNISVIQKTKIRSGSNNKRLTSSSLINECPQVSSKKSENIVAKASNIESVSPHLFSYNKLTASVWRSQTPTEIQTNAQQSISSIASTSTTSSSKQLSKPLLLKISNVVSLTKGAPEIILVPSQEMLLCEPVTETTSKHKIIVTADLNQIIYKNKDGKLLTAQDVDNEVCLPDIDERDQFRNILKPWTSNSTTKSFMNIIKIMLDRKCLYALFKCMGEKCVFHTSSINAMISHLKIHDEIIQDVVNLSDDPIDTISWLECSYCNVLAATGKKLVEHVLQEHGWSTFQCPYCFYRSASAFNVINHEAVYHAQQIKELLWCKGAIRSKTIELRSIKTQQIKNVKALSCHFARCNKKFFAMNLYSEHIKSHPGNVYKCFHCKQRINKTDILSHLQSSQIGMHQCVRCVFGTNQLNVMRMHLTNKHPEYLPISNIRSLRNDIISRNISTDCINSILIADVGFDVAHEIMILCPFSAQDLCAMDKSVESVEYNCRAETNTISTVIVSARSQKANATVNKASDRNTIDDNQTVSKNSTSITPNLCDNSNIKNIKSTISDAMQKRIDNYFNENLKQSGRHGADLFRCGVTSCLSASVTEVDFLKHMAKHRAKPLICSHCGQKFFSTLEFTSHTKTHQLAYRFICILCKCKDSDFRSAAVHMSTAHSLACVYWPINDKLKELQTDLFIVTSSDATESYVLEFIKKNVENDEGYNMDTLNVGVTVETESEIKIEQTNMDDMYDIPATPIFSTEKKCAICDYCTKVRTNYMRHLQFHRDEVPVSSTDPINPVSGDQNIENSSEILANNARSIICDQYTYVLEKDRFVCGAALCVYQTVDSSTLERHLSTLHSLDTSFECPHCHISLVDDDNVLHPKAVIEHLRMHDGQLYKCSKCAFCHYSNSAVETHIQISLHAKHAKPLEIRNIQPNTNNKIAQPVSKVPKIWYCGFCPKSTHERLSMMSHVETKHNMKSLLYCNMLNCLYRTNSLTNAKKHYDSKHPNDEPIISYSYRADSCEFSLNLNKQNEQSAIQPLWRRDANRPRSVRGIFFEEADEHSSTPPYPSTSTKSESDQTVSKLAKETLKRKANFENTETPKSNKQIKMSTTVVASTSIKKDNDETSSESSNDKNDIYDANDDDGQLTESFSEDSEKDVPLSKLKKKKRMHSLISELDSETIAKTCPDDNIELKKSKMMVKHSYWCSICKHKEKQKKSIRLHCELSHPGVEYTIHKPKIKLETNSVQKELLKKKCGMFFSCYYCFQKEATLDDIYNHWKEIHEEIVESKPFLFHILKLYSCIYCDFIGTFHQQSQHHNHYHVDRFVLVDIHNPLKCGLCDEQFSKNRLRLVEHFVEAHHPLTNENPLPPFITDALLEEIAWQSRNFAGPQKCGECPIKCDSYDELIIHYDDCHREIRLPAVKIEPTSYSCGMCRYESTEEDIMIKHIRDHALQFPCNFCIKEFRFHNSLTRHCLQAHSLKVSKKCSIAYKHSVQLDAELRLIFSNGLMLAKSDVKLTKYGKLDEQVIKKANLNETELSMLSGIKPKNEPLPVSKDLKSKKAKKRQSCSLLGYKKNAKRKRKNGSERADSVTSDASTRSQSISGSSVADLPDENVCQQQPYSFYGRPVEPVDYKKVYTVMSISDSRVRVSCEKFASLVNIQPVLCLKKLNMLMLSCKVEPSARET